MVGGGGREYICSRAFEDDIWMGRGMDGWTGPGRILDDSGYSSSTYILEEDFDIRGAERPVAMDGGSCTMCCANPRVK